MIYTFTQIGFVLLTILFFYWLVKTFTDVLPKTSISIAQQKRFLNTVILVLVGWAVAVSIFSLAGVLGNFKLFPFNVMPAIAIPLITILLFTFSKTVKEILMHLHPAQLIRLQVFRVFVEILLWLLFIQNLLPVQMTFEGLNFDILAGLTAPLISYLALQNKLPKAALIIWNIVCLGLLMNIVTVAILSMPTPFQYFTNEPANTIVTVFPISFLPTFLVPLAYMQHFLSLRQLLMKPNQPVWVESKTD